MRANYGGAGIGSNASRAQKFLPFDEAVRYAFAPIYFLFGASRQNTASH